jgi:protoheme IX farnesyltransferase
MACRYQVFLCIDVEAGTLRMRRTSASALVALASRTAGGLAVAAYTNNGDCHAARRWCCPFSGSGASTGGCPSNHGQAAAAGGGSCPVMGSVPHTACPVEDELPSAAMASPSPYQIVNQLGKAKLSAFVTSTASAGYVLCGGLSPVTLVAVTVGTYLQSLSANTSNQCIEIENDRMMKRTMKRPLVIGAITRPAAMALAATEFAVGTGLLATACSPTVAALGAANWLLYVGVYTPLKRVSTTNTWWGAIVGAIPPVMGGAAAVGAATGAAVAPAYLLGAVVLVWQIPHFMSLAFHCRRDYEKAGFKMLPFSHPTRASAYAVFYSVVMAGLTIPGPAMCGMVVEPWFYVASAVCNTGMVYKSVRFHLHPEKYCRSCFVFSYMYLAVMLGFFIANHLQPMTAVQHLYRHHVLGEPRAVPQALMAQPQLAIDEAPSSHRAGADEQ